MPFDLKAYRVVEYGVRIDRFEHALEDITVYASRAWNRDLVFGSPVLDYGQLEAQPLPTTSSSDEPETSSEASADDEPGFLDHMLAVFDGFDSMTVEVEGLGADMTLLTEGITRAGESLENTNLETTQGLKLARLLTRELGANFSDFRKELTGRNTRIEYAVDSLEVSLEEVLSLYDPNDPANRESLVDQVEKMLDLDTTVEESIESLEVFAQSLLDSPRIESRYNQAIDTTRAEIRRTISVLERQHALLSRASRLGQKRLTAQ